MAAVGGMQEFDGSLVVNCGFQYFLPFDDLVGIGGLLLCLSLFLSIPVMNPGGGRAVCGFRITF